MGVELPPFPVDATTLDLLARAIDPRSHGDREATTSSLEPLLRMMSELAGASPDAVQYITKTGVRMMRDPVYHHHDVIKALIVEVRRLRTALQDAEDDLEQMRCRAAAAEADLDSGGR